MADCWLVDIDNPLIQHHRVMGQHLLPGLAYIDLLFQVFRDRGFDYRYLALRNVSIYQPLVVTADQSVLLDIQCSEIRSAQWRVVVEGRFQRKGVLTGESRRYIVAEMHRVEPIEFNETVDLTAVAAHANDELSLDSIYAICRQAELVHGSFMQANGRLYVAHSAIHLECALNGAAQESAEGLMFHPVLIDASATCGGCVTTAWDSQRRAQQGQEPSLTLPLFYESFRASQLLQRNCIVRIQRASLREVQQLSYYTIEFFNEAGRKVAELKDFASKLVRDPSLIDPKRARDASPAAPKPKAVRSPSGEALVAQDSGQPKTQAYFEIRSLLQALIAERLHRTVEQIDPSMGYFELGINSTDLLELVQMIEAKLQLQLQLSPTLLFEYVTIEQLSTHLVERYADTLHMQNAATAADPKPSSAPTATDSSVRPGRVYQSGDAESAASDAAAAREEFAIIGMAGRFPAAGDIREYWENLQAGKDCITEIPSSRWDWRRFATLRSPSGKEISRWGGFIDEADCFDAQFFHISPREVELVDPQERIFLEICWSAIEDAGYTPATLVAPEGSNARRHVGVFAGVMHKDYALIASSAQNAGKSVLVLQNNAQIANRVSYYCDFHGPSMTIDTVCSSSLVAVHLALQSLRAGECEVALAGGVNLSLHPAKYLTYGMQNMHASDGRCRAFGAGGDGYVSSEAVAAVLLKPLRKAELDGDHIYAVIKGSGTNHVGAVSGFTVPNPVAQSDLIGSCLASAGIEPRSVSYVEAHGTGTSLGDPIEINGLVRAFAQPTGDTQFCAIGSVKSNIGHTESAAGVCGLIKVALQLQHRTLVPSLHSQELNQHIDWRRSPFFVQKEKQPWLQPVATKEGREIRYPRRAGLSSFGATGSNAHLLLEEYVSPEEQGDVDTLPSEHGYYIVPLSAQNDERLREYVARLLAFFANLDQDDTKATDIESADRGIRPTLADIAYTLQVGRKEMKARVAFVVDSTASLVDRLAAFKQGKAAIAGCYHEKSDERENARSTVDDVAPSAAKTVGSASELMALAHMWAKGHKVDWQKIKHGRPKRISLPTYPFARERHWVEQSRTYSPDSSAAQSIERRAFLHPLLHTNVSRLSGQCFSSEFRGDEFFLSNRVVNEEKLLPEMCYLEIARAAVSASAAENENDSRVEVRLKDFEWISPIVVDQPRSVHVKLSVNGEGQVEYKICSGALRESSDYVHARGRALIRVRGGGEREERLDLSSLRAGRDWSMDATQCYSIFGRMGIDYGLAYRGLQELSIGGSSGNERYVIAEVKLPECVSNTRDHYVLHPSVLDCAAQASVGLMFDQAPSLEDGAPINQRRLFALEEIEIIDRSPVHGFAYVRERREGGRRSTNDWNLDVDLCDVEGRVCVRLKGLSVRQMNGPIEEERARTILLHHEWIASPLQSVNEGSTVVNRVDADRVLLLDPAFDRCASDLRTQWPGVKVEILVPPAGAQGEFDEFARQTFVIVREILNAKPRNAVLLQIVIARNEPRSGFLHAISGLLKSGQLENPRFAGQAIEVETAINTQALIRVLNQDAKAWLEGHDVIRRRGKAREVSRWTELATPSLGTASLSIWKDEGVYLITGGAGGLGLIFAKEIASRARNAIIILTGRSALTAEKTAQLKLLEQSSARVEYAAIDVTDDGAVKTLVRNIVAKHGVLSGVIHSAGVIKDNFVIRKSAEDFRDVLRPKVQGILNLDSATQNIPLDCFIVFSSIAGVFGNFGQCDYATANAFMDRYATYRSELATQGTRSGRTLSIAWPLWESGGMQMDAASRKRMQRHGFYPLSNPAGIDALYRAWMSGESCVAVLHGRREAIDQLQRSRSMLKSGRSEADAPDERPIDHAALTERVLHRLKGALSDVTKFPIEKIDGHEALESYGIDSIMIALLNEKLGAVFAGLPRTLFFEYSTLSALCSYLLETYREECLRWTASRPRARAATATPPASVAPRGSRDHVSQHSSRGPRATEPRHEQIEREGIAIIGLAGRYPQARDIHEFWEHLKNGKNCIEEIPLERWPLDGFYEADIEKAVETGKSYSKWGGFVEGFADFDPLFFNIPPREAVNMDPQERLFLQASWEVLEDAGYTKESLAKRHQGRVGVYVGITKTGFDLYGPPLWTLGEKVFPRTSFSSVANRVSYLLDLHGPSVPIDTMCSASLTAIHEACEHLRRDECELAIAGGVNLYVHPSSYVGLCAVRMLSNDGACKSFGAGGNGFVPGEGIGAVLLKPLRSAIDDGDRIYGVIKSSAINHGGRTNGYTVPNPVSQRDLIERALEKASINPRTISYIEAHGTGTSLGDPIEIAGLTQAFSRYTDDRQYCAIGSVKSNIGHLESAAGIAGLSKVLLQMQHQTLVPSLHSSTLNPHIDFENTPFTVQQRLAEWKRPVVEIDGAEKEYPRIAGISSFGAGGANAHLIIEEYVAPHSSRTDLNETPLEHPALVVLSAKTEERLQLQAKQLLAHVSRDAHAKHDLAKIAYTLQVGREALEHRLAFAAFSVEGLEETLTDYVQGKSGENVEAFYRGEAKKKDALSVLNADEDVVGLVKVWLEKGKYAKLLELWVAGLAVDWADLYSKGCMHTKSTPRRVSLPTYPFVRERYWFDVKEQFSRPNAAQESTQREHAAPESVSVESGAAAEGAVVRSGAAVGDRRSGLRIDAKRTLTEIIARQLGMKIEDIDVDANLSEYGFDSVEMVSLQYHLERELQREIPLNTFSRAKSIADMSLALKTLSWANENPKQVRMGAESKRVETGYPRAADRAPDSPVIKENMTDRYQPFPLTDIQEAFVVGRRLGGSGAVGAHLYFEFELPAVDVYALNAAWNRLVDHHEMLRAVQVTENQQKILQQVSPYRIKVRDLRSHDEGEREQVLRSLRQTLLRRVYDPKQWPLFDIRISICPGSSVLHLSIDEFTTDAIGLGLLFRQWSQLYTNRDFALAPLSLSFRDVVLAQKQFETTDRYKRDLEYWMSKLDRRIFSPTISRAIRNSGAKREVEHVRWSRVLSSEEWSSLKRRAEEVGISPTVLLVTVFGEVLRAWSSDKTFCLAMTYFNRPPLHPQINEVVGPFISTGIFVIGENRGKSLSELMLAYEHQLWSDLDHGSVSGIRMLRELKARGKLPGSFSLPIVFTSLLNNQINRHGSVETQGAVFQRPRAFENHTPQVYLDHLVAEHAGQLEVGWDVVPDYFGGASTTESMFQAYCELLHLLSRSDADWSLEDLERVINAKNPKVEDRVEARTAEADSMTASLKVAAVRTGRYEPFPLTDQQQAYAFGRGQYLPGGGRGCQCYYEFNVQRLDVARLERAWERVMALHPMLTARIFATGKQQFMEAVPSFRVKTVDLRNKSKSEQTGVLAQTKKAMMERVFPLGEWPYFDLRVSVIEEDIARVHFSIDMLIADGTSIALILRDLLSLYADPEKPVGPVSVTFRDYMIALQRYRETQEYRIDLSYWESKFATLPGGPMFGRRADIVGEPGIHQRLSGRLLNWSTVKERALRMNVKPNAVLLASFMEVLSQWNRQEPFSVVVPSWQRLPLHSDIYRIVGDFTAMSWVANYNASEDCFSDKIRWYHETLQEDLAHQGCSGLTALRKMVGKRGRKIMSFPIVFTDLVPKLDHTTMPLGFEVVDAASQTPQVHLDAMSSDFGDVLGLYWDVKSEIYPVGMAEAMFAGYCRVLQFLADNPSGWESRSFADLIDATGEGDGARSVIDDEDVT